MKSIDKTSAIKQDDTILTGKPVGTWNKFPHNKTVETILELGCGHDRASLHLSKAKNLQCKKYYGIDISEPLLRRLIKFKQEYDFFPGAEFNLICTSAEILPLADNSIDLVISNCVFMHIPDQQLRNLMAEIARIIKPGGMFVFNHSFHNKACPSHQIHNFIRRLNPVSRNPVYLKQYSAAEITEILNDAGMKNKCPEYVVEPTAEYAILPETIKGIPVPFAKSFNRSLKPSQAQKENLAYGFSAYSTPLA
ncbi:class I SAM-dependent methyltransferase [Richelia sinica FACHB-800]|nr:class I SAM-dependent methyltransferase [Richelia sinica FACHB-800]